ncbi:hypothetical protein [Deinococcus soli (ex Cha et al. 2016)]|uniref:hypothetical protein n=1 Tax=Deinococcus soli (ex Cha et al. 2016) TaxID=1309411 RepID=UPI0016656807|nr:hypothetical protein [Deinococcus soli (ex Cha et al. 2016)]GGB69337.1 hypothetical protein GCM10008019_26900 [Deinococcus soli (ex Cha et al. 2016)]
MNRAEQIQRLFRDACPAPALMYTSVTRHGHREYTLTLTLNSTSGPSATRTLITGSAADLTALASTPTELQRLMDEAAPLLYQDLEAEVSARAAEQQAKYDLCLYLAEHLLGWHWTDGPNWDVDGPCEGHRILVPPSHSRNYEYPPRGVILPHFFTGEQWLSSDRVQEIERAAVYRLGHAYLAQLRASAPAGQDPELWVLLASPRVRCEAARAAHQQNVQAVA